MEAPPTPSGFRTDKPILSLINVDLLVQVANITFFNPIGAWMLPLMLRTLTFQYHHPPLWGSMLYAALVTLYWLLQQLNRRLAYGPNREFDKTEEVLVITGGASGLGLLIAQVYGMRGMSVAILDVNEPEVEVRNVEFYKCDVGKYDEVKAVSARIREEAAVRLLHESLTAEISQYQNIKTLLVCPGQISTPLFDGVETPSNFLAPVLEPVDVAKEIMAAIDSGTSGTLEFPLYARWITVMHVLPISIQKLLRWLSGCDDAMKTFRGRHPTDNLNGKN
ncbi:hypothetical protein ABW20_dc0106746 [Dactylellina cionopaga]|nr:hypothetical protein ABW20_dc0106746 [Dactylellina cionopaga]